MASGIYKPGQGYYTRWASAVCFGLFIAMGAVWLWGVLTMVHIGEIEPVYLAGGGALLVCVIGGGLLYYYIGKHNRIVDFMIAVEGEMKKVNWSTRREILGSTWVVIGLTFSLAIICFLFDISYASFFRWIHVLET